MARELTFTDPLGPGNTLNVVVFTASGARKYANGLTQTLDDTPTNGEFADYCLPLTNTIASEYETDMPSWVPAGMYFYSVYRQSGATPLDTDTPAGTTRSALAWLGVAAVVSPPNAWYYGDQTSLEDFIGTIGLTFASNLDNADSSIDAARVLRDGQESDAWFNISMRGGRYAVPITVGGIAPPNLPDNHETKAFFRGLSNRDVAARLNDHRSIQSEKFNAADIDNLMQGNRGNVNDDLKRIKDGQLILIADLVASTGATYSTGGIVAVVGPPKMYPGVPIVFPSIQLPTPTGNVSY